MTLGRRPGLGRVTLAVFGRFFSLLIWNTEKIAKKAQELPLYKEGYFVRKNHARVVWSTFETKKVIENFFFPK